MPFLLLPEARDLRAALGIDGPDGVEELIDLSRAIAVDGVNEARLAYVLALDAVRRASCDESHLFGRCHHAVARERQGVVPGVGDRAVGPRRSTQMQRSRRSAGRSVAGNRWSGRRCSRVRPAPSREWASAGRGPTGRLDHLVIAVRELDVADQIEQGLRWSERIVAASGSDCASTFTLPEWLHEVRAELLTEAKIARWQRVVDLLVVAGDGRVADLTD